MWSLFYKAQGRLSTTGYCSHLLLLFAIPRYRTFLQYSR